MGRSWARAAVGLATAIVSRAKMTCKNRNESSSLVCSDRYGRTLGRVNCPGYPDAGAKQVRRGMAWVYEQYAPKESPLYDLQAQAQREHRGLWADPQPVPPWEWRRARPT